MLPAVLLPVGLALGLQAGGLPAAPPEPRSGATVAERLEQETKALVGRPYLRSPLGEEAGEDPDPRFRLDAFDCTTFVETGVALALSISESEARQKLDLIRYEGAPSFQNRRHLMASQWIPGLIKDGVLEDITAQVGGDHTQQLELVMTKERWARRRIAKTLQLDPERVPIGTFEVPFISAADMERLASAVPPGTVINILRVEVPWSPVVVTHQGIVITKPGSKRRWVRHASPVLKRVIDEPLASMMKRYQKPRKWPIAGVNLLRVNESKVAP